jgi:ferredoxin
MDAKARVEAFERAPQRLQAAVCKSIGTTTEAYSKLTMDEKVQKLGKAPEAEMAAIVKARRPAKLLANNFLVNFLFSTLLYKPSVTHFREADKKYRWTEKCNSCGLCAKVCPANNIVMENGRPVWQHRCEQCVACLQWCPQEAIEFGKVTVGRKRYRHPDFTAEDFMQHSGEQA